MLSKNPVRLTYFFAKLFLQGWVELAFYQVLKSGECRDGVGFSEQKNARQAPVAASGDKKMER